MDTKIIKSIVSESTGVNLNDEKLNSTRRAECVDARKIYFTLCRDYTPLSLSQIGRTIKPVKDHSTVLYNVRETLDTLHFNKTFRAKFENIKSRLEYVKDQVQNEEMDFITSLQRLQKMEESNKSLIKENQSLLNQINQLNDKIKRQNRYLESQGYYVNKSIFKND